MSPKQKHERLEQLLGTALATKLCADAANTVSDTKMVFAKEIHSTITLRKNLAKDELTHLTEEARTEALKLLVCHHRDRLMCEILHTAAMLSCAAGDTIGEFAGHATKHFDQEREYVKLHAISELFFGSEADRIQSAAESSTGSDN